MSSCPCSGLFMGTPGMNSRKEGGYICSSHLPIVLGNIASRSPRWSKERLRDMLINGNTAALSFLQLSMIDLRSRLSVTAQAVPKGLYLGLKKSLFRSLLESLGYTPLRRRAKVLQGWDVQTLHDYRFEKGATWGVALKLHYPVACLNHSRQQFGR